LKIEADVDMVMMKLVKGMGYIMENGAAGGGGGSGGSMGAGGGGEARGGAKEGKKRGREGREGSEGGEEGDAEGPIGGGLVIPQYNPLTDPILRDALPPLAGEPAGGTVIPRT
jgi:hypothetical protein